LPTQRSTPSRIAATLGLVRVRPIRLALALGLGLGLRLGLRARLRARRG
jgi:hypothetical protein